MSDDNEKAMCPDCDERYEQLGIHWAKSSECDYPVPMGAEAAVLDGLMFVGGSLNMRNRDANCYVSIVHHDREALDWIAEQLGTLTASITEYDQAGSIDYHGRRPDRPLWEFRTRSLPALDRYHGWYDAEDNRIVPEDVEPRSLLRKTACLLAARPTTDRPGLYLSLRRTLPSAAVVERVFGDYEPSIVRNNNDGYVVRIKDAERLCDELEPIPAFARDRFESVRFRE